MKINLKAPYGYVAAVAVAVMVFGSTGVSVAYSEGNGDRGGNSNGNADSYFGNNNEDSVSSEDRQIHASLNTERNFGIHFRQHSKVCSDTTGDQVHCSARVVDDGRGNPSATVSPDSSALTPAKLLSAYGLTGTTSSSSIIAIVDAYDAPNIVNDLAAYNAQFGLPALPTCNASTVAGSSNKPCFQKVNQRGATSTYPKADGGWALEASLDVQMAHAICRNCSIILVESDNNSMNNLMAAVDRAVALGANVVSNSYGGSEFSGETAYDSSFNHPGVAFTVSSGDNGYGVEYPAASRYVTAVGGTTLLLNSNGTYNSEVAWSGSGSGCSAYEQKQIWQTDTRCSKRTVSDVSAVADPNTGVAVYDSYTYSGQRGWYKVGGTSVASPIIAGVFALSNNIVSSTTESSLPYARASVSTLHDVVSGKNARNGSSCSNSYLCLAGVGFDGPTGLGSPKGAGAF